jgi:mRNA interferase MazF
MPISFVPDHGQILMCEFDDPAFMRPEMQKIRQCVVVSPRYRRHTGCCVIVPISTVPPDPIEPYHYQLPNGTYKCLDPKEPLWIKGDMVTHAAFGRLDRPFENGRRARVVVNPEHLKAIQYSVVAAIGLLKLLGAIGNPALTNQASEPIIIGVPVKSGL